MKEKTMNASMEMPRYQSHKKVWALKIASVTLNGDESVSMTFSDTRYAPRTEENFESRYHGSPDDFGYFVTYQDGYTSWSPTKAFEDGYTLIENN